MDTSIQQNPVREFQVASAKSADSRREFFSPELGLLVAFLLPILATFSCFREISVGGINYLAVLTPGIPLIAFMLVLVKAGLDPSRVRLWQGHLGWLAWYAVVWTSLVWTEASRYDATKFAFELSTPYLFALVGAMFVRTPRQLRLLLAAFLATTIGALTCVAAWRLGLVGIGSFASGVAIDARPHSMSLVVIAAVAIAFFPQRMALALGVWAVCLMVTAAESSRAATLCILILPLLHPKLSGVLWRGVAVIAMISMAYAIFHLPSMQARLFPIAGSGSITDLLSTKTSGTGRFDVWPIVFEEFQTQPILGHGCATAAEFIPTIWPRMESPHNEFLRVGYEYGVVGLVVFSIAMLAQLWILRTELRRDQTIRSIALTACYLALIGFLVMGCTDNPLSSNIRYLNPLFCLMGAALASAPAPPSKLQASKKKRVPIGPPTGNPVPASQAPNLYDDAPDVSIVVCTYNRSAMLRETIESLLHQKTAGEFIYEIVVVDNNSVDDTSTVVHELAIDSQVPLIYTHESKPGQVHARHRGFDVAKGQWIANFDDDEVAEPNWVLELFRLAHRKSVRSVGGLLLLRLPEDCTRELHPRVRRVLGETVRWNQPQPYTRRQGPGSGNQLLHRSVYDQVGRYDLEHQVRGYDTDHYRRMFEAGIESWFAPEAVAYHITPPNRLTDRYLHETCFHDGWVFCRRDLSHFGKSKGAFVLLARLANAVLRHLPVALTAQSLGKTEVALAHLLMLRRAEGYARCYLRHCFPLFPQTRALSRYGLDS